MITITTENSIMSFSGKHWELYNTKELLILIERKLPTERARCIKIRKNRIVKWGII